MNTAQLLAEYAKVLNRFGPDSPQGEEFVGQYGSNPEFVRLARISAALKRALMPNPIPASPSGVTKGTGDSVQ